LSKVANHPVTSICAGRTDTGVHAVEQVIHIEVNVQRRLRAWVLGTNTHLPHDISILWAKEVDDDFHARFSALGRHYRYIILNRAVRPALAFNRMTWEHRPLDIEKMQAAAQFLIGTHDFSSYRAVACQAKTPVRTITQLTISQKNNQIMIDVSANAFLHHMIRNIAGVLIEIGCGQKPPMWAKTVLDYKDRTLGGVTAPPYGLYFMGVDYPEEYGLENMIKKGEIEI